MTTTLPQACGGILAEFNGRYFTPKDLDITESELVQGSSAKFSIEIPFGFQSPTWPALCAIIGSDGKKIFGGQYHAEAVKFNVPAKIRILDINLRDFYDFTRRKYIVSYKAQNTLPQHLTSLIQRSGARDPIGAGKYLLNYIIQNTSDTIDEFPDPVDTNPEVFVFEFPSGYLSDALTKLATERGYSWGIEDTGWERTDLVNDSIARIRFIKNGIIGQTAPYSPVYPPDVYGTKLCPNEGKPFYSEFNYGRSAPLVTREVVIGLNGLDRFISPGFIPVSSNEIVTLDVITGATQLEYPYPKNATAIITVVVNAY